jgi:hypothetical protein
MDAIGEGFDVSLPQEPIQQGGHAADPLHGLRPYRELSYAVTLALQLISGQPRGCVAAE